LQREFELRLFLESTFVPTMKDCSQHVQAPPIDEVDSRADGSTLVVCEPYPGGLRPDLQKYYDDLKWKPARKILTGLLLR
jgi:hypothetical protein